MRSGLQRGGVMIELAFASLGLAFFIVGATDIARIFQARSAVQAAVQEGLRCVYPLDASCGSSERVFGGPPSPILFDVWVGQLSQQYAIQQEYPTSSAQWSTEQTWRAREETTRVASLSIDRPQTRYIQQEVSYPVDAHAVYLVQTGALPMIGGSNPLSPVFLDRQTGERIAPQMNIGLRNIDGSTRRVVQSGQAGAPPADEDYYAPRFMIGEVTFAVADAWRGSESLSSAVALLAKYNAPLECYESPISQQGGRPVVQWSSGIDPRRCVYRASDPRLLFEAGSLKVPLMLRVSGSVVGTQASADQPGKLVMSMEWSSPTAGSGSRRLGGRLISSDSSGNLIVRGASWGDLMETARDAHARDGRYVAEIDAYGTLDLVPIDAQVTLSFFLSSARGQLVAWQGDDMQVYFPTFELVKERFSCGHSANPTQCVSPPANVPVSYKTVSTSSPLTLNSVGSDVCRVDKPTSFEASPNKVLQQIQSQILAGGTPLQRSFWTLASSATACPSLSTTHNCSAALQKTALRGCKAEEWPQETLLRECGFTGPLPTDAKLKPKYVTALTDTYVQSGECSGPALPGCAAQYREDMGQAVLKEGSPACASKVVHTPLVENLGPYAKDTCATSPYTTQIEQYRAKYNVPAGVSVYVSTSAAPAYITKDKPDATCRAVSEVEVREEVKCGSKVASAAVEGCCREAKGDCRYSESPGTSAGNGSSTMLMAFNQAIGRAVETAQAAFPAATYSQTCADGQPYCLQVSGELVDNNARARLSAQVHVPFTLLSAVGWQGTTVSYEEARVLEYSRIAGSDFVN